MLLSKADTLKKKLLAEIEMIEAKIKSPYFLGSTFSWVS
jgi:hypothetical protein